MADTSLNFVYSIVPLDYSPIFAVRQGVKIRFFQKKHFFVASGFSITENCEKHTVYNLPNIRYNSNTKNVSKFRLIELFAQSLSSRGAEGDVAISRLFPVPLFLEIATPCYARLAMTAWQIGI